MKSEINSISYYAIRMYEILLSHAALMPMTHLPETCAGNSRE